MKMRYSFFAFAMAGVVLAGCSAEDRTNVDKAPHVMKRSMDMATDIETDSNISQINSMLNMYKGDNDGKAPETLEEAKKAAKVPEVMWTDKVTGKPLVYDPATGTVSKAP